MTNKKLEHAATHDPLTKVANRTLFTSNLENAIKHASKNKKIVALLYIDLDHFKSVNDNYGHSVGDRLLISIVERLQQYLGKKDMITRLGGDELAIIIEDANNQQEVEAIAKQICKSIADPIEMNAIIFKTSASIGIAIYPDDGSNGDALLKCSDQNMYSAKKRGGNIYYSSKELVE